MAALAASIPFTGCFLGSDDSGPSAEDAKKSQASADKGLGNLEASVARMQDVEQFSYGKEDLTDLRNSHAEFAEAVRLDPGNNKAQLGMALTGVLLAAQSQRLSAIINRTLDSKSPFDTRLTEDAPSLRAEVLRKVAAASTLPEFHEIQDAVADTLLPALEEALGRLDKVHADPAFTMTFTLEGESRELDHAEVGVLLAGVHAIHGLLTMWLSYDIDVDDAGSYAYLEALNGIDTIENFSQLTTQQRASLNTVAKILGPTSPFLAVRPAWKDKLAKVDGEIKTALNILKESLVSVDKETDPQSDDLIHICAAGESGQCIARSDFDQGKDAIDTARKYVSQPYEVRLTDIDTVIKVNFAAYFNVQDFKKMMPYYGFYDANEWSEEKPVLYFTDASGRVTGNIKDLIRIGKDADSLGTPAVQVIAQIRAIIHLQDPTYQGFLPGATEESLWEIVRRQAEYNDSWNQPEPVANRAVSTLSPTFALSLIGN